MPGKFPTMGFETEFFTIGENGGLLDKADGAINLLSKKKRVHLHMRKEVFRSMLEVGAYPGRQLREVERKYLCNLREILDVCSGHGLRLLPLGCYPAKADSKLRETPFTLAQARLYGKKRYKYSLSTVGFHFHYSLPRGIVEKSSRTIRSLRYSKAKDTFINQYNFMVAADPALITFCQSSPFHKGRHFAKDARVAVYRDLILDKEGISGIHTEHENFGGLPGYEYTLHDLKVMSSRRKETFIGLLKSHCIPVPPRIRKFSNLRFMWGAVRVNRLGTLEYRGPDMNMPSILFSSSYLARLALGMIKSQNLQMLPSDIGLEEPFKREGDTVYLPPFSKLKKLELRSALRGFESQQVHRYCSALFNFVVRNARKKDMKRLDAVSKMLLKKKTTSDEILEFVEKKGYSPDSVPNSVLREVALMHSERLYPDVEKTIRLLSG
ncbi:hypothetical protein JW721_04150 [Candidatus Micrarchaeota archaeon]|nr:hypothetical protein [Candidatus Micrarchaeota archaeon]